MTTSPVGELDGVADQIDQDLAQPLRVADDGRRARRGRCRQPARAPSGAAREAERLHRVAEASRRSNGDWFEIELAGFDLEKSRMSLMTVSSDSADVLHHLR